MSNTETTAIIYEVLDGQDELVRIGRISGTFPDDTAMTEMVDDLLERAYEKEMTKSWKSSYSILATA